MEDGVIEKEVAKLLKAGVKIASADTSARHAGGSTKLDGKKFVITGTLPRGRDEVKDMIEANGGSTQSAVSAKTDFLLAGDEAGSKLKKAESLGVKIIDWTEFEKMLGR